MNACLRYGFTTQERPSDAAVEHVAFPLDAAPPDMPLGETAQNDGHPNDVRSPDDTLSLDDALQYDTLPADQSVPACPANYLLVKANPQVGSTKDFCVAKYEMKNVNGTATSQAAGAPWTGITWTTAKNACAAIGPSYGLISNPEWMTIARDVENTKKNWSTGIVASGSLNRGQSDGNPNSAQPASTDDTQACFSTGQTCDDKTWNSQRRTFYMSTGTVIWDLAGNCDEWIDWNMTGTKASPSGDPGAATPTVDMPASSFHPSNPGLTTAGNGVGRYHIHGGTYAIRGGSVGGNWVESNIGIYTLFMGSYVTDNWADTGFRCVYRPVP